ncbi:hypothetical protein SUDANB126_03118 [Streptomyces sp. enrichment culture]
MRGCRQAGRTTPSGHRADPARRRPRARRRRDGRRRRTGGAARRHGGTARCRVHTVVPGAGEDVRGGAGAHRGAGPADDGAAPGRGPRGGRRTPRTAGPPRGRSAGRGIRPGLSRPSPRTSRPVVLPVLRKAWEPAPIRASGDIAFGYRATTRLTGDGFGGEVHRVLTATRRTLPFRPPAASRTSPPARTSPTTRNPTTHKGPRKGAPKLSGGGREPDARGSRRPSAESGGATAVPGDGDSGSAGAVRRAPGDGAGPPGRAAGNPPAKKMILAIPAACPFTFGASSLMPCETLDVALFLRGGAPSFAYAR